MNVKMMCYSNVMVPGNSVSIARQFIRCVLHQLAPNGIFPMLFQSNFDGKNTSCLDIISISSLSFMKIRSEAN